MTPLLLLLSAFAHAANVDNLEIGGLWGSPGATDATALWWNPAGLAADTGTRVHLEGAPTLAGIKYDRDYVRKSIFFLLNAGVIFYILIVALPFIALTFSGIFSTAQNANL